MTYFTCWVLDMNNTSQRVTPCETFSGRSFPHNLTLCVSQNPRWAWLFSVALPSSECPNAPYTPLWGILPHCSDGGERSYLRISPRGTKGRIAKRPYPPLLPLTLSAGGSLSHSGSAYGGAGGLHIWRIRQTGDGVNLVNASCVVSPQFPLSHHARF